MPIAANRYYNDPNLGAAFSNLAGMFAPPSGADLSGYATANAKKQEAERLAQLFTMAQSPEFDQSVFDRSNIAAGNYNPTQSFYAQDQNTDTQRYGIDTTAATSRANNAADNAGALERLYAAPVLVNQGQSAFLPDQTAAATGLDPVLSGAMNAAPGEKIVTPGGATVLGTPKPLTESEFIASIMGDLPANEQRAKALGDVPVESVMSSAGTPENVFRADSIGMEPAPAPSTAAPETQNYKLADGTTGTAVFDRAKGWLDSQTQQPLPAGAITYNASLQGDGTATGLTTTSNATAGNNLNASLDSAEFTVSNLKEILAKNGNAAGVPARIVGLVQSATSSLAQTAAAFTQQAPDAVTTLEEIKSVMEGVAKGYDPDIVRVQSGIMDLAYLRAQINNPSGEVSRQAFERALEQFSQGVFSSQLDLTTALDAFSMDTIGAGRVRARSLLGQGNDAPAAPPAVTGAPAIGAIEDGYVFKGGDPANPASWEPAQ